MTAFLWSFAALARLGSHQDPGVKCWAADRMHRLYPEEAGPLLVRLLSDGHESVTAQAGDYFCDHPDRNFTDALLAEIANHAGSWCPLEDLAGETGWRATSASVNTPPRSAAGGRPPSH